uniref:Uncharacterized protein n=1 Tax=Anguilla anguilla TaxID=7936 RepID=A0A0E9UH54_ANGAN
MGQRRGFSGCSACSAYISSVTFCPSCSRVIGWVEYQMGLLGPQQAQA